MPEVVKPSSPGDVVSGQVPAWMDASFFQMAIREGGEDPNIRVAECEVGEATTKGENYVSIVYRAVVKDEGGQKYHLIIKCLPSNEARKKLSNQAKLFRKEIDMYQVVFPAYRGLQGKLQTSLPWPKHLYSFFNGDRDYLVMEDLKENGYVMRERHKGLDRNHLEVALSALAEYHAYSYALKIRDPEVFKRKVVALYPETLYAPEVKEMIDVYVNSAHKTTAVVLREWGGQRYERLADKIERMAETTFDEVTRLMIAPVEPGALLTHGDFWVNNMLFKYARKEEAETGSGKPVHVKLLDFQVARYGSLVSDLVYLMVTSTTAETRREHWDNLLEHTYLASFWNTLETLGHKGDVEEGLFSLDWLKAEIKRFQPFAFVSLLIATPAILAEVGEVPDLDALTEEDMMGNGTNPFADLNKGKIFQERLKDLLDEFDEGGFFD